MVHVARRATPTKAVRGGGAAHRPDAMLGLPPGARLLRTRRFGHGVARSAAIGGRLGSGQVDQVAEGNADVDHVEPPAGAAYV